MRNLIVYIGAILAWLHTTHDFNFYFNQYYAIDRVLVLLSLGLVYWRPVFSILFLLLLFPLVGQLEVLDGFSLSTTFLLTRIIILFIAVFSIHLFYKRFRFINFIFIIGCFVASNYIVSGAGKIALGQWLFNDAINYLIPATYTNGWSAYLGSEALSKMTYFLGNFNAVARMYTILIECGFLFLFFHIKWARFLFFGALIMHLGIFFYSGILFWMWMLVLLGLLFVFRKGMFDVQGLFNRKYLALSFFIILGGKIWINPSPKVWFDSPVNYTYTFEATLSDDSVKRLPPDFFSPYDVQFTFSNFKVLSPDPLLNIIWGATESANIHNYFKKHRTESEIFDFEQQNGRIYQNEKKAYFTVKFIQQYIRNRNKESLSRNVISYVRAPRILWTFPRKEYPKTHEQIKSVQVFEITAYFSEKEGYQEIRKRKLIAIPILE